MVKFEALQIDYYYGRLDPKLRLAEWRQDQALQTIDHEALDYAGSLKEAPQKRQINRCLGLNPSCFAGDSAGAEPRPVLYEDWDDATPYDDASDDWSERSDDCWYSPL